MTELAIGSELAVVVAFCGAFGLLIGSFLNVVAYRVPAGRSIVSPPSACPNCNAPIRGFDNIPVLSWLVLRGRCRDCRTSISMRYPLVELATGIFFTIVAVVFWPIPSAAAADQQTSQAQVASILTLVAFLYLAAVSVVLALIDLDTHRLPNSIVLPSYIVGAVLLVATALLGADGGALVRLGVGMVALFTLSLALGLVYPGGMGFGDIKLAGVLGLYLGFLGWGQLIVGAFSAFLIGGVVALVLLALRRANRRSGIPFGPSMLAGAWVGILFGGAIASGYLSLFGLA